MSAVRRQARANLLSARVQTGLVASTIVAAAALLTVALASFGAAGGAFDALHDRVDGAHLWLDLDPDAVAADAAVTTLAALPGVAATTGPRPTVASRLRFGDEQQWLQLRDWPGEDVAVARTLVVDGRAPVGGEDAVIALDRNLADHYEVALGDDVEVLRPDGWAATTVVGLTVSADMCPAPVCEPAISHLPAGGLAAAGLLPGVQPDAERLAVGLRLTDPDDHAAVLAAAEAALPTGAVVSASDHGFLAEMSDFMLRIQSVFLAAFGVVAVLAAGFLVANAIGEAVRSHTRQIGLLKAVGFTRRQLAGTYLLQELGLALVASLVGVAAGVGLAGWSLSGVSAQFGQSSPGVPVWVAVVVPVAVVGVAGVFTLLPVRRAARVDVITAMRTGTVGVRRRTARLSRLPVSLATAVVDLRSRPTRTVLTAAGLALATLTLGFASLVVTTLDGLAQDPRGGLVPAADLTVQRPEVMADGDVRRLLAAEQDVAAVRSDRWVAWSLTGDSTRYSAFAVDGDLAAFTVPLLDGRGVASPGEAIAGFGLATEHDLAPGDTLSVEMAGRRFDLAITGIYREIANQGQAFTFHADTLAEADPDAQPSGYQLLLADGADADAVAAGLAATSGGLLAAHEARSFAAPVLDTLPGIMLALVVVLIAIALVGVLNSVWMGVQERTRELGLLKAVGMSSRQIVGSVLAGAATMALLGYLAGLPAALLFTRLLLDRLGRSLGFGPIDPSIEPAMLALALPVIVAAAVAGALLPARRAARLPVADALRAD